MHGRFRTDPDGARVSPRALALPALLLAGLAGCAGPRGLALPEMADWEARRAALADLTEWEFRGRVAVRVADEGFNGRLRWWQRNDIYLGTVSGPFGAGTVRIQGDGNEMSITDEEGAVTEMEDAEAVLRRRYGWAIPVQSLRYWALGIPDPGMPAATQFGEDGLLERLEQGQWVVALDEYMQGGGQPMPRRMTATQADTRVRIVIDTWIFY